LGQVEPALEADLAAAVAGHVLSVGAREGDRVRKGARLVTLDSARLRAELAAAKAAEQGLEAELAQAEKQLARVRSIDARAGAQVLSAPELERYELDAAKLRADLAVKRAEIRRIQVELSQHTMTAPFAGVVTARRVDPGAWVSVGQPVIGLVQLDELEVLVDVSAELGRRVSVGETARLLGKPAVEAEIAGVVGALDRETRTMRLRLVPRSHPPWLVPGMAVDVQFDVTLDGEGVTVSRDALIRGPVSTRVVKYVDGKGVPVEVEVLATAKGRALIRPMPGEGDASASLTAGDQIVVRGNERLRPGQALAPVQE
jgi:RND family efflux transporter MFP subunit